MLITCRDLAFAYDGRTVLEDVNFGVGSGEYWFIVGGNGSGKSTLIKGLLRLKAPLRGSIAFGDGLQADHIGYLPQQTVAQKDFPASVMEVVLSGLLNSHGFKPFFSAADRAKAKEKLALLDVADLADRSFQDLSGGQRQRILLARALCAGRKMLLLDEPASALDPLATQELYQLIARLNREEGITVLMVSHDLAAAERWASHVLHLGSRQLFAGPREEYLHSDAYRHLLGGDCHD